MPVLECIKIGNKLYCYNSEDNTVSSYLEQRVSLNECPDYVIGAFINKKYNVKIAIKENEQGA